MKIIRSVIVAAIVLPILACSNFLTSSGSKSSTSSSSTAQAAYAKLDVTDSSAWADAVSAGNVRQGTVLVKTGSSFSSSSFAALGATQTGSISVSALGGTWRHLSVANGTEAATILALRKITGVLVAEPEMRLHLPENETRTKPTGLPYSVVSTSALTTKSTSYGITSSTVLDDPYVASAEYSLTIAKAINAYSTYPLDGSETAYAAVLDTGLNMNHEEFLASGISIVVRAKSAFSRNSSTSYEYVGDGGSFVDVTIPSNWDDDGHGTHVAGIVGALGNNGTGGAGVMWSGLKLISYKVITDYPADTASKEGSGSDWAVYGALKDLTTWWAGFTHTQKTLPVNMSLGSYYASEFETEMITYALQNNVVVIAAMGNDGKTTAEYPAAYTGVIAVGATNGDDTIAPFSTSGSWISVSAPGADIISTYIPSSSDYEYESGTSMATPFVTGLSAYAFAYAPTLLPDQLKTVLMESADSINGSSYSSISTSYGAGRVNVLNTLNLATGTSGPVPASGSVYSPYPITITVTGASNDGDIPVYLYDSSGNYVEVAYTGEDTGYVGTVSFWLLKPGSYTAKANYNTTMYSSGTISLTSSASATGTITL
jgi:thermitase